MAKTEKGKRSALPLTLARKRQEAQSFISQALAARPSANSPARLVPGLAQPLADGSAAPPAQGKLGRPLDIRQLAGLIGCSPWTVRQKLLPLGLPFFRSAASGKLIFYEVQVVRWIEKMQGGKK